jgi:hypothetical protein
MAILIIKDKAFTTVLVPDPILFIALLAPFTPILGLLPPVSLWLSTVAAIVAPVLGTLGPTSVVLSLIAFGAWFKALAIVLLRGAVRANGRLGALCTLSLGFPTGLSCGER